MRYSACSPGSGLARPTPISRACPPTFHRRQQLDRRIARRQPAAISDRVTSPHPPDALLRQDPLVEYRGMPERNPTRVRANGHRGKTERIREERGCGESRTFFFLIPEASTPPRLDS